MIILYTTIYQDKDCNRTSEYLSCLRRNLSCISINKVIVLNENFDLSEFNSKKLFSIKINRRPCFSDFFHIIDQTSTESDINIIANTDIYFDQNISILKQISFHNRVLALSRWDVVSVGNAVLFDRNDSQDAWIFKGKIKNVNADFMIGIPRCDNRLAYEFEKAGYEVLNPSFNIRSYHLHAGESVEYPVVNLHDFVPPPYKYIWPHNLFSLPKTLWYNLQYPRARLSYRIDKRKLHGCTAVRVLRKFISIFNSTTGILAK
jgi:hypothetical protein